MWQVRGPRANRFEPKPPSPQPLRSNAPGTKREGEGASPDAAALEKRRGEPAPKPRAPMRPSKATDPSRRGRTTVDPPPLLHRHRIADAPRAALPSFCIVHERPPCSQLFGVAGAPFLFGSCVPSPGSHGRRVPSPSDRSIGGCGDWLSGAAASISSSLSHHPSNRSPVTAPC